MIKYGRPDSFFKTFTRKDPPYHSTTYCPGCGHGMVHKMIARTIDELDIQDRMIMQSPVGCSVFMYYYFDTGNIQCSHGRSPAVATGVRHSVEDAIVICYQGDGDLAGIGTTEIIHAANRGENITVFFINNAIYGMTGGQMAPTTLVGQKTATTPEGRSLQPDGGPIGMAEVINALKAPVYIERVSLASPAKILKAQKAVKKAIVNQMEKKGFSFVEILSPCPVNWKLEPVDALSWIEKNLEPVFPVKLFRDVVATAPAQPPYASYRPWLDDNGLVKLLQAAEKPVARNAPTDLPLQQVKICGFGGQGVLSAGILLANCAIAQLLHATWLPSYGAAMRGGTANASVILSSRKIGSPVVDIPNVLIALNGPSLDAFEDSVSPGGAIYVNSSLVNRKVRRTDVQTVYVPASDIAKEVGFLGGANVLILTLYMLTAKICDSKLVEEVIPQIIRKRQFTELNLKIVKRAQEFFEGMSGEK
jgi:2-oxoisovalerate ferredoxin oxidoreductase beta subunit